MIKDDLFQLSWDQLGKEKRIKALWGGQALLSKKTVSDFILRDAHRKELGYLGL